MSAVSDILSKFNAEHSALAEKLAQDLRNAAVQDAVSSLTAAAAPMPTAAVGVSAAVSK